MKTAAIFLTFFLCFWAAPGPALAQTADLPDESFVSGVPGYAQGYTLSCESRSAVDWAAYFGVDVDETQFVENLPRSDNPEKGFVGDPNGYWGNIPPYSYGVHAPPVAAELQSLGLPVEARSGLGWDDLRAEIASAQPVIVWIIGQMWSGTPIDYTDSEGDTVTVAYYEHTMILTGYTSSVVYVIDAYSGLHLTYYLDTFLDSWSVLGNQAVIYTGEIQPEEPQAVPNEGTYTVQAGDYLNGLAGQLGIPWQDLAAWNRLDPPYTIYAGQVLITIAPPEEEAAADETPEPTQVVEPPLARPEVHVVAPGDSLFRIAAKYDITWQELVAQNGLLYPYFLYPHQELQLPASAIPAAESQPVQAAKETPVPPETPTTYTVQRGDGLIMVAESLGLNWQVLAELNGIEYPYTLYPGRILLLR